ncbi:uncharacterized protein BJ212DRAFT_914119 [Suillus subaureus]|uniref:Methyltransferase domain-containing protein n=1 Tax=Suillus subaureus TaxID=48587 RepID=A0A9P7EGX3_9AGAM|nr:uncharacterized protein BJ212DRAFT_914119 [Suillus subaureus]KAG1821674.1 hypothetical protein BJ212DRAFT_914119 [Suillus subaureus]
MEGASMHEDSMMTLGDVTVRTASVPTVDTSFYNLSPAQAAFFKTQTGIDDDEDLKRHILEVQAKAYKVAPYPCIHVFNFLRLNLSNFPVYEHILQLGRERPDAVLLDIGCCFGVDARKAAADGFPAKNVIASDIVSEFLQLSHELFKTTPASYPGCLLPGDVFDPEFLSIAAPSDDISPAPAIDLSSLKTLNSLHGRISAINAITFFHLFNEEKQLHVARALAGLLSAQPGSVICGFDTGSREKGTVTANLSGAEYQTFSHSPETWSSMWDGEVFEKGTVKVETEFMEIPVFDVRHLMMRWSVTVDKYNSGLQPRTAINLIF